MLGNPGPLELLVILFIILLLFGGKKLPELARSIGVAVREYHKALTIGIREEKGEEAILEAARKLGIET